MSEITFSGKPDRIDNEDPSSWSLWLEEGRKFLKAGCGGKGKFNTVILYNLLAMAFEKFVMAILGYRMAMPLNHTFTDLIEALEEHFPLPPNTKDVLMMLETKQEICSFENAVRSHVSEEDIRIMRETVSRFEDMALTVCIKDKAPVLLPLGVE